MLLLTALGIVCLPFVSTKVTDQSLQICPIQAHQCPAPTALASENVFLDAIKQLEDAIRANLTESPYNGTTFSLGMFSTSDDGLVYEFHHTDPGVANSHKGTTKADADSIYRLASITKILTLYLWLIKDGDRRWNDPITDFIPQLAASDDTEQDYITPDWSEITINDMAMYLAGISRDYGLNDVALTDYVTSLMPKLTSKTSVNNPANGINISASDDPKCGYLTAKEVYQKCDPKQYLQGVKTLAASFPSGYTPLYSNQDYALIGLALENLTGATLDDLFNSSLVQPLGLRETTFKQPSKITKNSVIPNGDEQVSQWNNDFGPINAAAGAFSTTNDLAAIGKSILNSTLVPKATTRRWFSVTSHLESLDQSVGRGWEIYRQKVGGHTVDLFTKAGYWGDYTSVLFLIPSYNFGFSLLTASVNETGKVKDKLSNVLTNMFLPVLEECAKNQARRNFAGHYTSSTSNTTVRIEVDEWPALKVTEYIVNDIDFMATVFGQFDASNGVDMRLVPNHLYKGKNVGFTGVYQALAPPTPTAQFYGKCPSWLDVDDFTYASVPLGHMVFEVDDDGRAERLELKAVRERLDRTRENASKLCISQRVFMDQIAMF